MRTDRARDRHPAGSSGVLAAVGLVALLALTALAVGPSLNAPFTFDEQAGVVGNRALSAGVPLREALRFKFSPDQSRPLFFLSLWIDSRWNGLVPRGFRLTNLALHLLCGTVVFALLRRAATSLGPPHAPPAAITGAALSGTALFLLHPLQSESIIYVWGRSGVLAALLGLLALLALPAGGLPAFRSSFASALRAWLPAWLLLALALVAKEEAVMVPVIALIWWVFVDRLSFRSALARTAWLSLPVATFMALRAVVLGAVGRQVFARSLADNILVQGIVHLRMLALTLWPEGQSIDHAVSVPPILIGLAAVTACAGIEVAALVGATRLRNRALRAACAGALVSGAGTIVYWVVPLNDIMFERRAYLPLFGAALTVACLTLAATWSGERQRSMRDAPRLLLALAPAIAIAVLLAPELRARARVWADAARLWQEAARLAPSRARPVINLGVIAAERGDRASAAAHLEHALELEPRNPEALYNRGRLRLDMGDLAGAAADLAASVAADPTVPRAHIVLAVALIRLGRLDEAEEHLRTALSIDPGEPRALTNLAEILRETGRVSQALPLYRQALASDPAYAHAAVRLGVALEAEGDLRGALDAYREYLARGASTADDRDAVLQKIRALEKALASPSATPR